MLFGHTKPMRGTQFFGYAHFASQKEKTSLDLQISISIVKPWKSYCEFKILSWKYNVLIIFYVHISNGVKIALSTHWLGNI